MLSRSLFSTVLSPDHVRLPLTKQKEGNRQDFFLMLVTGGSEGLKRKYFQSANNYHKTKTSK